MRFIIHLAVSQRKNVRCEAALTFRLSLNVWTANENTFPCLP